MLKRAMMTPAGEQRIRTRRTWPVFLFGLGSLLVLCLLPGWVVLARLDRLHHETTRIQERKERTERDLAALNESVYQASVLVRDALLNAPLDVPARHSQRAERLRGQVTRQLAALRAEAAPEDVGPYERLQVQWSAYWASVLPVFTWSAAERAERSGYLLWQQQRPRRTNLLATAEEIRLLWRNNYTRQQQAVRRNQEQFRASIRRLLLLAGLVGVGIAVLTSVRISALERRQRRQQAASEMAREQMRRLSQQLMQTQEEERRTLSRELHDEIGQTLTGLRLVLGHLERKRNAAPGVFAADLQQAKELTEQTMRTVREIARGLRPSMLDDLGLVPALEWQVREFERQTGTPVHLAVAGDTDRLPDNIRTCCYRVVQEALTNCARHAQAQRVSVALRQEAHRLEVQVADDGVGLPLHDTGSGIGLLGMQERVSEVGGTLQVLSSAGQGVCLTVHLPLAVAAELENAL